MATFAYAAPQIKLPAAPSSLLLASYPVNSAQVLNPGDIAIVSSGQLSKAASNVNASIAGICLHGSAEIFTTPNANVARGTLFGYNYVGSGLFPAEPSNVHVLRLDGQQEVEMSLSQATNFAQSLIGTTAGITLDATSGFFYVDPSETNKPLTIVNLVYGPGQANPISGTDLGGRVVVTFAQSALV